MLALASSVARADDDLFTIERINVIKQAPEDGSGIWVDVKDPMTQATVKQFYPSLQVEVRTHEQIPAKGIYARLYVFDPKQKLVHTVKAPRPAIRLATDPATAMPIVFQRDEEVSLYFPLPDEVAREGYTIIAVFGDQDSASAKAYPADASTFGLKYPEESLVEHTTVAPTPTPTEKTGSLVPKIQSYIVMTNSTREPQITFFVRLPPGITDGSQVQGVMALCILAHDTNEILAELIGGKIKNGTAADPLIDFADKHNLAVLAWGSLRMWDPTQNYESLDADAKKAYDENFDEVAQSWKDGVQKLCKQFNLPDHDFLMWGSSGAGQFALRLGVRIPEMFLAVHAHIPSSFDQPTPDGKKVLWLLTTGELEGGYGRSLDYYKECRAIGYPMIYKAIIGLGHTDSRLATNLGLIFFDYALSMKAQRDAIDNALIQLAAEGKTSKLSTATQPWPTAYRQPPFVGDIVNQAIYSANQVDKAPADYRVALPTKDIADAWNER